MTQIHPEKLSNIVTNPFQKKKTQIEVSMKPYVKLRCMHGMIFQKPAYLLIKKYSSGYIENSLLSGNLRISTLWYPS